MDDRSHPMPESPDAGTYEIRLEGHLDARWAPWFDGLTVSREDDGTTLVSGPLPDQAALHGVLQRARDLGIPLISLRRLDPDPAHDLRTTGRSQP